MGEVLDLQSKWQASTNAAMERRGELIKHEIRDWIQGHTEALGTALDVPVDDVLVEGKDAAGSKAQVPWTRVASASRSPKATKGWYIVYLFSADGERVYLSLMQYTSVWIGGDSKPRDPKQLQRGRDWARRHLGPEADGRPDLLTSIALSARTGTAKNYEPGTVVALEYRRDAMPGPEVLRDDLLYMARLLARVYKALDTTEHVPGDTPLEVIEARDDAARAAGRRNEYQKGQGRRPADERLALEEHSVRLATEHFEAQGWKVKDVGKTHPYDLRLTRGDEKLHVEVKGTTSDGSEVNLTSGEVKAQRKFAPNNALVIVHSIELDRSTKPVTATGGVIRCIQPWSIEDEDLRVVSYTYRTGL